MKTPKLFATILLATMVASTTFAQSVEKTLVKSFNLKGQDIVLMDVAGNVEVKEWNGDIMRIQMSIELTNGTNSMLKSLVQARRYNLMGKVKGDEYVVNMPSLAKQVKIRGKELKEKISYTVFVPADVQVKLSDDSTVSKNTDMKNSSSL